MSDETRINPLENFDPFAETAQNTSDTVLHVGDNDATIKTGATSKLGWKSYTIAGISAVALAGGALASVKAFSSEPSPTAKATPKHMDIDEEEQTAEDEEVDVVANEPADDNDNTYTGSNDRGYATSSQASSTMHARVSNNDYTGDTDSATAAPVFDHYDYSPIVVSFSDNFGFGEAFAAARQMCGVGGTFVWHGNVYSTYYREEWDAMTPHEQELYLANANQNFIEHSNEFGTFTPDEYADYTREVVDDDEFGPDTYDHTVTPVGPTIDDDDDMAMTFGEVRSIDDGEGGMTVGDAVIDGHVAAFVDVDNDGVFDVVGIDANDNMELDEDEIFDIQDANISVKDFELAAKESHQNVTPVGPTIDDDDDMAMTFGEVHSIDDGEGGMTVGDAIIDGHIAAFVDVDNDGVFDVVGIDANDNMELDEDEIFNIQDAEISVSDFEQAAQESNPMAYNANLDDFTNDADVSDFV